jgi:hypothetical protein
MTDDLTDGLGTVDDLTSRMAKLDQVTAQFGRSLSRSLAAGIVQGKSFEDILRGLGEKLIEISLRAAFSPLESSLTGALSGLSRTLTGSLTGSSGLFGDLFGSAGTTGTSLFGAAGGRGPAAQGVTVNMAVNTPDAESFRRSEAQISAALARSVARGQRSL